MLTVICAALALSAAPSRPPSDEIDILYFAPSGPRLLRLHLRIDGQPYRQKFDALINSIFDGCDRNRDGVIDAREAARLPDLGGSNPYSSFIGGAFRMAPRPAAPKGPFTRAGLEAHYRAAGIVPFQMRGGSGGYYVRGAGGQRTPARITARVFKLLDVDGDGKLSSRELAAAERKLLELDADEDELVGVDELMDAPTAPADGSQAFVLVGSETPSTVISDFFPLTDEASRAEALRRLRAAGRDKLPTTPDAEITADLKSQTGAVTVTAGRLAEGVRLRKGATTVLEIGSVELTLGGPALAGNIFLAAFDDASRYKELFARADADRNGYLDRKEAAGVPFFAANFDAIDADGDGMIFEREVAAHVKRTAALQAGVKAATVTLSVEEQGQGLFDLLDLNRDGVLSVRELRRAPEVLKRLGVKALAPADVPRQLHAGFAAGGGGLSYGGFVVLAGGGTPAPVLPAPGKGPAWFRHMDRNGDGDVSRTEWLGTKAEFDSADTDGDGLISAEEAEAYEKRARRKAAE